MYVTPGSSISGLLFLDICNIQIQIQGGAVCVTLGSSSSSELLLSLSDEPKRPKHYHYQLPNCDICQSARLLYHSVGTMYMVCLQGGAVCVTPGSSSSGELLLSLSDGPAASPGSTAGEPTTTLWQLVLERKQLPSE